MWQQPKCVHMLYTVDGNMLKKCHSFWIIDLKLLELLYLIIGMPIFHDTDIVYLWSINVLVYLLTHITFEG